jgi:class 3 adenylate cyclase
MSLSPDTAGLPRPRIIVAVDIENSTARINTVKAKIRAAMYELLEQALAEGGIAGQYLDPFVDRGDGILSLVHATDQTPKALMLDPVVPILNKLLIDHCAGHPDQEFRLRVVVHAGDVHYDGRGCFGDALDLAFRLLDAAELKARLSQSVSRLGLVVSDDIYQTVIRHRYRGLDENTFEPGVNVRLGGRKHRGWLSIL